LACILLDIREKETLEGAFVYQPRENISPVGVELLVFRYPSYLFGSFALFES
jgi:hypothetical protein